MCLATGFDYDYIENFYCKVQNELNECIPNSQLVIDEVMKRLGYVYTEAYINKTTHKRERVSTFLKTHNGEYILKTKGHLCFCKAGKVMDTWDSSNCLLIGYFEKVE